MGLETTYGPVERFVNRAAGTLLSSRRERTPYKTVGIENADIVRGLAGKKHLIGVFGPHKTTSDSTLLTSASLDACPERAITFLSRPPSKKEHSKLGYIANSLKLAANPLLHPVYTMRDTNPKYLFEKNEESMLQLVRYHRRVKPTVLYLAPDGGSSPGNRLDGRYTKARGLLMLLGSYLKEGVPLEDIAVVPVALNTGESGARVVFGQDLVPGIGDLIPGNGSRFWMDAGLNAQVAEALLQSINTLIA